MGFSLELMASFYIYDAALLILHLYLLIVLICCLVRFVEKRFKS